MSRRALYAMTVLSAFVLWCAANGQAVALSNARWEFKPVEDGSASGAGGVAAVQNKNQFVVLAVSWLEDAQEYIIALHSDNLIDRSRDIRFGIDDREEIVFKGSRDWRKREFSIRNLGKSVLIGSPRAATSESLQQRKQRLIKLLQSGHTAVVRYEEIVYGGRTVRFTLEDSRDTITRLRGKTSKEPAPE